MKASGTKRIAERYVKALFDIANSAGALVSVEKDLAVLLQACEDSAEFRDFLDNPLLNREAQLAALTSLLESIKAHEVTRKFITMVAQQKRLSLLPDMAQLFSLVAAQARGEMKAELIAAAALRPKEVALIAERLGKAYGRKVNLEIRHDPSLIGGVIVRIGSQQLDGSVSGKISRMKQALRAA